MAKTIISTKFNLITPDVQKILIGAFMAGIGAVVTFVLDNIQGIDFGQFTVVVGAVVSVLANIIRKWIAETKY